MKKIANKQQILTFPLLAILLATTACQTTKVTPVEELTGGNQRAEVRLATKAQTAILEGRSNEALKSYEYKFKKSAVLSDDTLLNYSQLLRNSGKPRTAIKLITKYALDSDGNVREDFSPVLLNELAANRIENGEFKEAANVISKVLENNELSEFHADAHNLLAISLDAEGNHSQAEVNFRLALEAWRGDVTSVKNNLAVCLASQGKFDEALMHLRQALIQAPNKEEISKNIELINSLRESIIPKAKSRI